MSLRHIALLLVPLTACESKEPNDSAAADSAVLDSTSDGLIDSLAGTITWNVDFDEDAEADGAADCAYTRTNTGLEDRSAPCLMVCSPMSAGPPCACMT